MDPSGRALEVGPDGRVAGPEGKRALVETTVGRAILNDSLPAGMPYYNYELDKKTLNALIFDCHRLLGRTATLRLLDDVKELGFKAATRAGLSISKNDMRIPASKADIVAKTEREVEKIEGFYRSGIITEGERYNKIIDAWTAARERVGDDMMRALREDSRGGKPYLNPIFAMVRSAARGSIEQIRQIAGMRGLMAKPSGKIIETPIRANFREGLRVLEYFSSTHGARKGLADTALKTADSGYLTRKLADVAQNVVVSTNDCGTPNGIPKETVEQGEKIAVSLAQAIRGRVARQAIVDVVTDEMIVQENEVITEEISRRIEEMKFPKIFVRSPLTCEASLGVCALCYGMDLSRGALAEEGLAVGIIAAQSIGEPGTQLTMRTFHVGGTASRTVEESEIRARRAGIIRISDPSSIVGGTKGKPTVLLKRNVEIVIVDRKDRELDRTPIPYGAELLVPEGKEVREKEPLARWDPHHVPILADKEGKVRLEEVVEGRTMKVEREAEGMPRKVIIEHKGDLHPQIVLVDAKGSPVAVYPLPEKAYIEVEDEEWIEAGKLLAKTQREISGTQDITGGLPRVTELFEARKPKEPAVISEIDGDVELGEKRRGKRTIIVKDPESGIEREHLVPQGKHLRVHKGDRVRAGEPLVEGPLVPHDILRISGEEAAQQYLLREVQGVYRSQGVTIDDKHIEIILAQMMRKVQVDDPGEASFLPGAVVDRFVFRGENERLKKEKKRPALGKTLLLGVTKAALQSDSFISAASFQETTKVLTEAALGGRRDDLVGLKENVILGHLVPTGTGFRVHYRTRVKKKIEFGPLGPPGEEAAAPLGSLPPEAMPAAATA